MIHALSPAGREMLDAFVARGPLLAFDIDGTLAPLVAVPGDARIPGALQAALADLARLAPVVILTGRGRADAQRMVSFAPAYVLGNHGVEGLPGWEKRTRAFAATTAGWRASLAAGRRPALADAGIDLEDKRFSLSLHYRHAPDHDAARALIAARVAALEPAPRIIFGKCVVNALPPGAPTKGDALRELIAGIAPHLALYAGDDDTDEHVFELPRAHVLGVRVGAHAATGAALYVDTPGDMLALVEAVRARWTASGAGATR